MPIGKAASASKNFRSLEALGEDRGYFLIRSKAAISVRLLFYSAHYAVTARIFAPFCPKNIRFLGQIITKIKYKPAMKTEEKAI
ncbi:MAG: hypothetical protein LBU73_05610 [Helicobacteraceae bacterium]|nr:hypothetical protein [Helicobacteraceae bacterium]